MNDWLFRSQLLPASYPSGTADAASRLVHRCLRTHAVVGILCSSGLGLINARLYTLQTTPTDLRECRVMDSHFQLAVPKDSFSVRPCCCPFRNTAPEPRNKSKRRFTTLCGDVLSVGYQNVQDRSSIKTCKQVKKIAGPARAQAHPHALL